MLQFVPMARSDLEQELPSGAELKSASTMSGELCVMICGAMWMPELSADNLDTLPQVPQLSPWELSQMELARFGWTMSSVQAVKTDC